MFQDERDVGNEETDFRIKNLLSWQNILSNRQVAVDIKINEPIKGNSFPVESVVFTLPDQTNGNHATQPRQNGTGKVLSISMKL